MDAIVSGYVERKYFPSAVLSVYDHRGVRALSAFGDAAPDTWYDLASVTKIVTTTLVLFEIEKGHLSMHSPVLSLLPAEKCGNITKERLSGVTVLDLMTHHSGLIAWYPFYCDGGPFYSVLEHALAASERQTGFVYSDLNFMLMGEIFQFVSGMDLRQGVDRYIHDELGIAEIEYGPIEPSKCAVSSYGNQIEKRMCRERGLSFHGWREDGKPIRGACNDGNAFYYWHGVSGHAGTFGTAAGLSQLGLFYLNCDRPVFLKALDVMRDGRGLGFDRSIIFPDGHGHNGFTGTAIWFSRKHDLGAVLLTNKWAWPDGHAPGATNEARVDVFYHLLGQPVPKLP